MNDALIGKSSPRGPVGKPLDQELATFFTDPIVAFYRLRKAHNASKGFRIVWPSFIVGGTARAR